MKDIAIYGAGGFGREIACIIKRINQSGIEPVWNLVGFFDDGLERGTKNEYGVILGGMEQLNHWGKPLSLAIAIGTPAIIEKIVGRIENGNVDFPNIIDPSVLFFDTENLKIGQGNIICGQCSISCHVSIGDFNVLNVYTQLGHDSQLGNYNVIMPSCNLSGGLQIGNGNFFGVKSTMLQYLKMGNNVRLGAGSVLMRNAKEGFLYMGNPAVKINMD